MVSRYQIWAFSHFKETILLKDKILKFQFRRLLILAYWGWVRNTLKTFIHNIPKAQPNGNCRLASPVLRRWHYLWQSMKPKLFFLKDKHLLWRSTTPKRMKLQTPDWSHFKGFKQLLKMRQPWIMQPFLFGSSTFPKMVFVSQEKRFLQRLNGG